MPWGAAIAAGGSLIGGYLSSQGASDAADTQAKSADKASALTKQMYDENVARLSPWTQAGSSALGTLQGMMPALTTPFSAAQYEASPGYQWQLGQGIDAIQNSAAARGGVNSGNTMRALMTYGQGLAGQDYQRALQNYQNWQGQVYNMYSGLSNTGVNAAGQVAGLGAGAAGQIGANTMQAGNALSAGQVAQGNMWGNVANSLGSLGAYGLMNQGGGNPYGDLSSADLAMLQGGSVAPTTYGGYNLPGY